MRAGDLHWPERCRRLVDGDEVRRVSGPEEERLPASGTGLHGCGVVVVRPAGRAETPEVQHRGQREQRDDGRAYPGGVFGAAAPQRVESALRKRISFRRRRAPRDVGRRRDHGAGHGSIPRCLKITRSSTTNCTTHNAANTARFPSGSANVRGDAGHVDVSRPHTDAMSCATTRDDTQLPARTSRRWRRARRPTHRRPRRPRRVRGLSSRARRDRS